MRTLIQAAWIAPMDAPMIRDGAVVCAQGRIEGMGLSRSLRKSNPDAEVVDAGDSIILPGLVNAHTHLELSAQSPPIPPPASFVDWILHVIARQESLAADDATRDGVRQCVRFGVSTVGDITARPETTRRIVRQSPLRVVSFGEVRAMARRRELLQERLAAACDASHAGQRLRIGISPHAPYSTEPDAYRACLDAAHSGGLPLATHLAETPDEAAFLADHAGPFRRLWDALGAWDDRVPQFAGGPVRFAQSLGLLDHPAVLAHVNYCDDDELAILARGRASVVYCPRTHAYFGHPKHRWRDMLGAGINVAVGTDSCATSPDLNVLDELRLLHRIAPDVSAEQLWHLATTRAAAALGMSDQVGSLTPSKFADFVVFPAAGRTNPLQALLENADTPTQLWIAGSRIA